MDSDNPTDEIEENDHFLDALDDFPFYDCVSDDLPNVTTSEPSTTGLRQRKFSRGGITAGESEDGIAECSTVEDLSKTRFREGRYSFYGDSKGKEENLEVIESTPERVNQFLATKQENDEESTITTGNDNGPADKIGESADLSSEGELSESSSSSSSSLLVFVAGLVIKAIGFQISLLVTSVTLPIWLAYFCCLFIFNPFQALKRVRNCVITKLSNSWDVFYAYGSLLISKRLQEHKWIWKQVFGFAWGLFWAAYVCCVLSGLLISSFVIGGFFMRYLVEEPIQIKELLNFDYTKNSPVAFVPISSCAGLDCDGNCMEKAEVWNNVGSRVIPPDHKLQVTVSLTLPESQYNRRLGIFQVRVDFLSHNGKILASSRHPCMLKFKSEPLRLLLTFLQVAPLLAGYISESQTLYLKIRGLHGREVPTACLRVLIEQRAEYKTGAGIPEIYDASLILESELPLFKRIIWYWKKTIFVWVSITTFIMELLVALICCRPVLIPRTRSAGGSADSAQNEALQSECC